MLSTVASLGSGTPRKVLQKAADIGVHADCVASDIDGACDACVALFHTAFAFYYGHHDSPAAVLEAVVDDLLEDRKAS